MVGKPLHPPLTDFPIAAYVLAAGFDVISAIGGEDNAWGTGDFWHAGTFTFITGAAVLVFAALTGLWDARNSSEAGTEGRRTINSHATIMITVTVLALVDIVWRLNGYNTEPAAPIGVVVLSVVIALLVSLGRRRGDTRLRLRVQRRDGRRFAGVAQVRDRRAPRPPRDRRFVVTTRRRRCDEPGHRSSARPAEMDWAGWALFGPVATATLTVVMVAAQMAGLTRLDLPLLLGTIVTADPDRARAAGFFMHMAIGLGFALGYAASFALLDEATWWLGGLFGLLHVAITLTVLVPLLPGVHPRITSPTGPDRPRRPCWSRPDWPASTADARPKTYAIRAHLVYGIALGVLIQAH